jgi:DNA polymerase-3 subunit epsilon
MGVALCPCAGGVDAEAYKALIDEIVTASVANPGLLLDPIAQKMRRLASERRFEEAAQMRDRHRALARALERGRAWSALQAGGQVILKSGVDETVMIDSGRLAGAWNGEPLMLLEQPQTTTPTPVPLTLAAAEETHLIWQWMTSGRVRIVGSTGAIGLPANPIPHLQAA